MDLREQEIKGSYKWLMFASGAAVLLSCVLFWADNTVMGGAAERDKEHAAKMRELRIAQSSVPGRVTDSRQTLPLTIEQEAHTSSYSSH